MSAGEETGKLSDVGQQVIELTEKNEQLENTIEHFAGQNRELQKKYDELVKNELKLGAAFADLHQEQRDNSIAIKELSAEVARLRTSNALLEDDLRKERVVSESRRSANNALLEDNQKYVEELRRMRDVSPALDVVNLQLRIKELHEKLTVEEQHRRSFADANQRLVHRNMHLQEHICSIRSALSVFTAVVHSPPAHPATPPEKPTSKTGPTPGSEDAAFGSWPADDPPKEPKP